MAEITNPALLSQLDGPAPSTPSATPVSGASGEVKSPALLALLNSDHPGDAPATPTKVGVFDTQAQADDFDGRLGKMWADPKTSSTDIRNYLTSNNRSVPQEYQHMFDQRDSLIANHDNPAGSAQFNSKLGAADPTSGPADNRPVSFPAGIMDGVEHVGENMVGAAGLAAKYGLGIDNNVHGALHDWYVHQQAIRDTQGSNVGKFTGEIGASLPALAVGGPVEGAATELGAAPAVARGVGLATDGAVQGALTTNATTPGGMARDAVIGAGANLALGGLGDVAGRAFKGAPALAADNLALRNASKLLSRDGVNVPIVPSDVSPTAAAFSAGIGQGPVARGVIGKVQLDRAGALGAARDRAANALAPAGETAPALIDAAKDIATNLGDHSANTSAQATANYEAAQNLLPAGFKISTPETVRAIDNKINRWSESPTADDNAHLQFFQNLRDKLSTSQYSVQGLRDMRTDFFDKFGNTPSSHRIWGQITEPLSVDINNGMRAAGHDAAADAWQVGDAHYAQRAADIKDVATVIGKKGEFSPERIAGKLTSLASTGTTGNADLLARTLKVMDPDVAARTRGALVRNLGIPKNGFGDFSFTDFTNNWQGMSDGAKSAIITDPAVRADMDAISTVSRRARGGDVARNYSNTAGAGVVQNYLRAVIGSTAAIGTLGSSLATDFVAGKAITNPAIARAIQGVSKFARPVTTGATVAATQVARRVAPPVAGYLMNLPRPGDK